ncbi:MAG TPA: trypsin-like peptidase domain-containing protein [Tepidisphaeraceae bacterium]|nr:trypsin-like peptidase domain-containing protein [Tepidisphaeraceae bacterium]
MLFARRGRGLAVTLFVVTLFSAAVSSPQSAIAADRTIDLVGLQDQFSTLASKLAPSVVAISSACDPVQADNALRSEELTFAKVDDILGRTTRMVGTGFFIDSEGYILTNEHVIGDSEQLWVTTDDRTVYPAIVVGSDPRTDLAVLKIAKANTPPVTFAATGELRRGQWTIALGNPYGYAGEGEMAMSVGVVSATGRSLPKLASKENRLYTNLIQTTAEINPGNSGGPLFGIDGSVIGVNTAVILPNKQANGIGFAMPITPQLLDTVKELKQGREIVYGYLGILVSTPTTRERKIAGVDKAIGARVDSVEPDTPASNSDLQVADVIVSLNGEQVDDADDFIRVIGRCSVDKAATMQVARAGTTLTVEAIPRRRPMPHVAVTRERQRLRWQGLVLSSVPANFKDAKAHGATTGLLVVGMDESSPLAKRGIALGTVITTVAGKTVGSILELQKIIEATPQDQWEIGTTAAPAALASNELTPAP